MDILKWVVKQILIQLAILSGLLVAPVIYLTVPFILIALNPNGNWHVLALIYILFGPFAASAWMIITRMVSRHRRLTADGTPYKRSLEGILVACGWMVVGFIGSAIAEFIFLIAFYAIFGKVSSTGGWLLWFAIAPFATFSPVILGWAWPAKAKYPAKVFGAPVRGTDEMAKMADDGKEIVEGTPYWNWYLANGYKMVPTGTRLVADPSRLVWSDEEGIAGARYEEKMRTVGYAVRLARA